VDYQPIDEGDIASPRDTAPDNKPEMNDQRGDVPRRTTQRNSEKKSPRNADDYDADPNNQFDY
jgi:hypothetical protein